MRKIYVYTVILSLVFISSCVRNGNSNVDDASGVTQCDTLVCVDTVKTDTVLEVDTTEVLRGEIDEDNGYLKKRSITLTEVEFYPPGLKEAYETYIMKSGIMKHNQLNVVNYCYLTIFKEVFTFTCVSDLVNYGDYDWDPIRDPVGYTTINGVDVRVYLSYPELYKHIIVTKENPKTFTVEYMQYPELVNEVGYFGGFDEIFGALDLENIPEIGEEINDDEEITYVFYPNGNMLWDERDRRNKIKAEAEANDSVITDSVVSDNPVEEEQNDN